VLAPAATRLDRTADIALRLIAPADPQEYARRLYTTLHELDAAGAQRILIARPPAGPDWEAIADRLGRAAG
jgi:L-threonylcarbamoyladenylate synthase